MTLLEEMRSLLAELRYEYADLPTYWRKRIETVLARAAEAGDQGADVEARTAEAIAAWLAEQATAVRDIGATAALKTAAKCLRSGTWRPK